MEQISMFPDEAIQFPQSYDDLQALYEKHIFEGEKDDDVFTWNDIKDSTARSYFFYGTKVFEFYPAVKKPYIKVIDREDSKKSTKVSIDSPSKLIEDTFAELKDRKRYIFRNLVEDTFACCNDFKKCSAVDKCIHPEDRFYNGCLYRRNLEAGRNFYKEENT